MGSTVSLCQVGSGKDVVLPGNREGKVIVSMFQENPNYSSNRGVQRRMPSARGWNVDQYNGYNKGQQVMYNPSSYGNLSKEPFGRRGYAVARAAPAQRRSDVPSTDRNAAEWYKKNDVRVANVAPAQGRMREGGKAEILQRRLNEVWHDLEHCRSNNTLSAVHEKLDILQRKILEISPNEVWSAQEEQIKLQALKLKTLERKVEELVAIANGQIRSSPGGQVLQHGEPINREDVAQPKSQGVVRDVPSNIYNLKQHPSQGYFPSPTEMNSGMESARSRNMAVNETSVAKQFSAEDNPTGRYFRPLDKRMDVANLPYWNEANTQTNHVNGRSQPYGPTYPDRQQPMRPREEYRKPNPKPGSIASTIRKYIKNPFKAKISQDNKPSRRQGAFAENYQRLPTGANANNNLIERGRPNNFVGAPTYTTQVRPVQSLAPLRTSLHQGWDR